MRFDTSTYIDIDIEGAVRKDPLLSGSWPAKGSDLVLPWPSPAFDRLMQIADQAKVQHRVSCRTHLASIETNSVPLWQMQLDSYCATTDRDERWWKSAQSATPFVPGTLVRRFETYRISKLKTGGKITGTLDGFFFPQGLIRTLLEDNLSDGASWTPIFHLDGVQAWGDHKLLVVTHLIGPVKPNPSMEWSKGPDDYAFFIPKAWLLAMSPATIDEATDFNLTTEPTAGYNRGSILVSPRVRACVQAASRKGVFFTPVLATDSTIYQEFLSLWSALHSQVVDRHGQKLG